MDVIKMGRDSPEAKEMIKNQLMLLLKFHNLDHDLVRQSYVNRGFSKTLVEQAMAEVLAKPGVSIERNK